MGAKRTDTVGSFVKHGDTLSPRFVEDRERSLRRVACTDRRCRWKSDWWGFHISKARLIGYWQVHMVEAHPEYDAGPPT